MLLALAQGANETMCGAIATKMGYQLGVANAEVWASLSETRTRGVKTISL